MAPSRSGGTRSRRTGPSFQREGSALSPFIILRRRPDRNPGKEIPADKAAEFLYAQGHSAPPAGSITSHSSTAVPVIAPSLP